MGKSRLTFFTLGVGVLILLLVLFFGASTARRSGNIQLPADNVGVQDDESGYDEGTSALPVLEITPETVQQAVATLSRPAAYARSVTVTTYWDDGWESVMMDVAVLDGMTRIDSPSSGDSIRHLVTDGVTTCLWYDAEREYRKLPSGSFSADAEQRIPTWEDILELSVEEISVAVYGEYEGLSCICVVTEMDEDSYHTAYWISLESGLLVAAETRQEDELVYRMTALSLEDIPEQEWFRLPDGTILSDTDITENG